VLEEFGDTGGERNWTIGEWRVGRFKFLRYFNKPQDKLACTINFYGIFVLIEVVMDEL